MKSRITIIGLILAIIIGGSLIVQPQRTVYWKRVIGALHPTIATNTIGSPSKPLANLYVTAATINTLTVDISSLSDIIIQEADPSLKFDVVTAGDTDYWIGVQDDAAGDDNDKFHIGDGATPGTNPFVTVDTSGNVGIGVTDPDTQLEILNAGNQLKLSFDGTDNTVFAVDTSGDLTITPSGSKVVVADDIEIGSANAFYYGGPTTDTTWRTVRSGTKLSFQRRETGAYVEKGFFDTSFHADKIFVGNVELTDVGGMLNAGGSPIVGASLWQRSGTVLSPLIAGDDVSIESSATTGNALRVNANSLTAGYAGQFYSNSADISSRRILSVINDNTLATGAISLYIRQDSNADIVNIFDGTTEVFTILDGGSVGIGVTPDASAIFEIKSTNKGFLLPRMTTTERNAIASAVTGLEIYNITTNEPEFFNGSIWQNTGGTAPGGSTTQLQYNNSGVFDGITGVSSDGTILYVSDTSSLNFGSGVTPNDLIIQHLGVEANIRSMLGDLELRTTQSFKNIILQTNMGGIGIGTSTPHASAMLDVWSFNKGFLLPRITTLQRNAIAAPAEGLEIYNVTNNEPEFFNGSVWLNAGGTAVGGSPTQLQFNNGGVFGGITGVTSNGTNLALADGVQLDFGGGGCIISHDGFNTNFLQNEGDFHFKLNGSNLIEMILGTTNGSSSLRVGDSGNKTLFYVLGDGRAHLSGALTYHNSPSVTKQIEALVRPGQVGHIDQATASGTHQLSPTPGPPLAIAMAWDGSKVFIGDNSARIRGYDLSTHWDITTASAEVDQYDPGFSAGSVNVSPDGLKLITSQGGGGIIRQANMATPWNLSLASTGASVTPTGPIPGNITDIITSRDGHNFYILSGPTGEIFQYYISEPFEITTMGLTPVGIHTLVQTSNVAAFDISNDGRILYVQLGINLCEFALGIAWDITSTSSTFTLSTIGTTNTRGGVVKPDGTRFYQVDFDNPESTLHQFDLGLVTSNIDVNGNAIISGDLTLNGNILTPTGSIGDNLSIILGNGTAGIGGTLALTAGAGVGGNGGNVDLTAGAGNRGGNLIFLAGAATLSGQPGGVITLDAGASSGNGLGGLLQLRGGQGGTTGPGGQVSLKGGLGGATSGSGGSAFLDGGDAVAGNSQGGIARITAGNGSGSQSGGDVELFAGEGGTSGNGGEVLINAGDGYGGSAGGTIEITAGEDNASNYAHIKMQPFGGFVGIGTSLPDEKLVVSENAGNTADTINFLSIETEVWPFVNSTQGIRIQKDDGSKRGFKIYQDGSIDADSLLKIDAFSGGFELNTLVIRRNNGNVGIGTSSPNSKLHVNGNILTDGILSTDDVRVQADTGALVGFLIADDVGADQALFVYNDAVDKTSLVSVPSLTITSSQGTVFIGSNQSTLGLYAGTDINVDAVADINLNAGAGSNIILNGKGATKLSSNTKQIFSPADLDEFELTTDVYTMPSGHYMFMEDMTLTGVFIGPVSGDIIFEAISQNILITMSNTGTLFTSTSGFDFRFLKLEINATGTGAQAFDVDCTVFFTNRLIMNFLASGQSIGNVTSSSAIQILNTFFIGFTDGLKLPSSAIISFDSIVMQSTLATANTFIDIGQISVRSDFDAMVLIGGPGESLFNIDPTLIGDVDNIDIDNANNITKLANFFKPGTVGGITLFADVSWTNTIERVDNNAGIARFILNVGPGAPLVGQVVTISGFITNTSYNGTFIITAVSPGIWFEVGIPFTGNELSGSATAAAVRVTSAAHGFSDGQTLKIRNTLSYDNGYTIYNAQTNTFEINDVFVTAETGGRFDTGSLTQVDPNVLITNSGAQADSAVSAQITLANNTLETDIPAVDALIMIAATPDFAGTAEERIFVTTEGEVIYRGVNPATLKLDGSITMEPTNATKNLEATFFRQDTTRKIALFNNVLDRIDEIGTSLVDGDTITFNSNAGTLPGALRDDVVYFVVQQSTDSFHISYTSGGSNIAFSDNGIGINTYATGELHGSTPTLAITAANPGTVVPQALAVTDTDDILFPVISNKTDTVNIIVSKSYYRVFE